MKLTFLREIFRKRCQAPSTIWNTQNKVPGTIQAPSSSFPEILFNEKTVRSVPHCFFALIILFCVPFYRQIYSLLNFLKKFDSLLYEFVFVFTNLFQPYFWIQHSVTNINQNINNDKHGGNYQNAPHYYR